MRTILCVTAGFALTLVYIYTWFQKIAMFLSTWISNTFVRSAPPHQNAMFASPNSVRAFSDRQRRNYCFRSQLCRLLLLWRPIVSKDYCPCPVRPRSKSCRTPHHLLYAEPPSQAFISGLYNLYYLVAWCPRQFPYSAFSNTFAGFPQNLYRTSMESLSDNLCSLWYIENGESWNAFILTRSDGSTGLESS